MKNETKEKRRFPAIFALCPVRHGITLLASVVIVLHLITRSNHSRMEWLSAHWVRPMQRTLAGLTADIPFSLAEVLIAAVIVSVLLYIVLGIAALIRRRGGTAMLYKMILTPIMTVLVVYALFCSMWGVYFYGDDFAQRSGLDSGPVSAEDLAMVTAYFAQLANDYADVVPRDKDGGCATDRASVLQRSAHLYDAAARRFPDLSGVDVPVKGIHCSRVMSYLDFTGFYFPITGEANVNMDFPAALFASTVAHEISHQRGVAKEQEANFVAILSSLESGDADYIYSAALLAYTHLGNALHAADYARWENIYRSLREPVLLDFAQSRDYWRQFETPVQTVSNTVYEGFLQSYDQHLGLKSYGACVDLLVNYYAEDAAAWAQREAAR